MVPICTCKGGYVLLQKATAKKPREELLSIYAENAELCLACTAQLEKLKHINIHNGIYERM